MDCTNQSMVCTQNMCIYIIYSTCYTITIPSAFVVLIISDKISFDSPIKIVMYKSQN